MRKKRSVFDYGIKTEPQVIFMARFSEHFLKPFAMLTIENSPTVKNASTTLKRNFRTIGLRIFS